MIQYLKTQAPDLLCPSYNTDKCRLQDFHGYKFLYSSLPLQVADDGAGSFYPHIFTLFLKIIEC